MYLEMSWIRILRNKNIKCLKRRLEIPDYGYLEISDEGLFFIKRFTKKILGLKKVPQFLCSYSIKFTKVPRDSGSQERSFLRL